MTSTKSLDSCKTFILGLGNQKCATTWLYQYLSKNSCFEGGFAKEYHIWDALDIPILQKNLVTSRPKKHFERREMRYKMQHSSDFYFDYFQSLYKDSITLSADITPSYSSLKIPRLKYIKSKFCERDIDVKVIILIRNPINRIKSAVRYNLDRHNYDEGIELGETDFYCALNQYYQSEHCRIRTSYNETIANAYEVFDESKVYIGIYENMFEVSELEKLSQFLQVPVNHSFVSVGVNKTEKKGEEDSSLDMEIRSAYADVYEYCYAKFPVTRDLWG